MKLSSYIFFVFISAFFLLISSCTNVDQPFLDTLTTSQAESLSPPRTTVELVPNQYIVILKEEPSPSLGSGNGAERSQIQADGSLGSRDPKSQMATSLYQYKVQAVKKKCVALLTANRIPPAAIKKTIAGIKNGMVVSLNPAEKKQLEKDPAIDMIEQDQFISLSQFDPQIRTPFNPAGSEVGSESAGQIIPAGITRVGGSFDFETNPQYSYRWVWIMDTGINDHDELEVLNGYSVNFSGASDLDDDFGHGTHVAGIIGAKNDNEGVVGVAAGVYMVNIKVLDDNGLGYASDIVAALGYISYYVWPEDVINMSIGGGASNIVDNTVLSFANVGVKVVVAAGNGHQNVSTLSPARVSHPNIFVVTSIDSQDSFSYFSNYGNSVDYAAPGEYILSTFDDDEYAYCTGTSMAAPHVSGVLLVAPSSYTTDGTSSAAPDGTTFPVIVR
ncbi:MAG: S8 family serine peptidase [Bacteroidota bacterium]